jgi:hypothetical protein
MPKLKKVNDAQVLWSTNHYDGILSGVAMWQNQPHYFNLLGTLYSPRKRRAYTRSPLTEAEFLLEDRAQAVFRLNIGIHCDYVDDVRKNNGTGLSRPKDSAMTIRNVYRLMNEIRGYAHPHPIPYLTRTPVGYF